MGFLVRTTDFFLSALPVWVCPVNCRGALTRPVAAQFAAMFPGYYEDYRRRCRDGALTVGQGYYYPNGGNGPDIITVVTLYWPGSPADCATLRDCLKTLRFLSAYHAVEGLALPSLLEPGDPCPDAWLEQSVREQFSDTPYPVEYYPRR